MTGSERSRNSVARILQVHALFFAQTGILAVALGTTFALPSTAAAQSLFINDATAYTMARQPVLQQADILIRNGRIASVGRDLTPPADAAVIEAGGRKVTPALFAGITALGIEEVSGEDSTVDKSLAYEPAVQWDKLRPEFDVTPAYNPWSVSIPVTRIEGYGWTLLSASRTGSIVGGQGRAVVLDGGYDSFVSAPVLFIGLGAGTSALTGQSRAAQYMILEQAWQESASDSPGDGLLTPAGRNVIRGLDASRMVVFEVNRASDILQALEFASRHQLNSVISGGAEAWMVADRLAESGVPVLLNPLENLPADFDQIGARLDNAALLHEAGVTIAFTGSGDTPHNARKQRQAAGVAVAYGLPYEAGLEAITVNPATIFNLPAGYGTLANDAPANLVVWSGDPLEVTSLAKRVVLNGRDTPMVSRQTRLRDRYLPPNPELPRAYINPQ